MIAWSAHSRGRTAKEKMIIKNRGGTESGVKGTASTLQGGGKTVKTGASTLNAGEGGKDAGILVRPFKISGRRKAISRKGRAFTRTASKFPGRTLRAPRSPFVRAAVKGSGGWGKSAIGWSGDQKTENL